MDTLLRASRFEFRVRYFTHTLVYLLGFLAPWERWIHFGEGTLWLTLAWWPARAGWLSFQASSQLVLAIGILCAAIGAALRVWGASYLGAAVVQDGAMHGNAIVADGPYRHLRNPLYVGTVFNTLALALLMPPSGAIFTIVLIVIIQMRLIGGEESYLASTLGERYAAYKAAVPPVIASVRAKVAASGVRPRWIEGMLGEMYVIGVAAVFAAFGWKYNSWLLVKGVVISFGLSLVARAFLPGAKK